MILKLSDLKAFLPAASNIPTYGILPIHDFIRCKDGILTKSNANTYVSMKADFTGEALIEERVLGAFMKRAAADIKVTQKGNKITLDDGVNKISSPTDDIANFPHPQLPDGVSVQLSETICKAIGKAAGPVLEDPAERIQMCHVFIGDGAIVGTNNFYGMRQDIEDNPGKLFLTKAEAKIVGGLPGCTVSETENWHFFQTQSYTWGTIKSQGRYFDLRQHFNTGPVEFTIMRSAIVGLLETALPACAGKDVTAHFVASDGKMRLCVQDKAYDIDAVQELDCPVDVPVFGFDPGYMLKLLNMFTADEVDFCPAASMYLISGTDRVGLIMQKLLPNE